MLTADRLSHIERLFFDAALEPERWPEALQAMAEATGSTHGQLIGIGGPAVTPFNCVTDAPRGIPDTFEEIDGHSPEVNFRVAAGLRATELEVVTEDHYDAIGPHLSSEDYVALCAEVDIPHGVQTNLQLAPDSLIGLACLRTARDGRSNAEQREAFGQIVPVAARAVKTQIALENRGTELAADTLEAMDSAAILIDGTGRALAVTAKADAMLAQGCGLRLHRHRLTAVHPPSRAAFGRALARALRVDGRRQRHRSIMMPAGLGGEDRIRVDIMALPLREWSLPFRPRVIVTLRRPQAPPPEGALLGSAFGLTHTEAEVAVLLAAGHSRSEIADMRGVSLSTIVTQLKSVFAKLDVNRETAAVALIRNVMG